MLLITGTTAALGALSVPGYASVAPRPDTIARAAEAAQQHDARAHPGHLNYNHRQAWVPAAEVGGTRTT